MLGYRGKRDFFYYHRDRYETWWGKRLLKICHWFQDFMLYSPVTPFKYDEITKPEPKDLAAMDRWEDEHPVNEDGTGRYGIVSGRAVGPAEGACAIEGTETDRDL